MAFSLFCCICLKLLLPWHCFPSLHENVCDPTVFWQKALTWQLGEKSVHSFMSENKQQRHEIVLPQWKWNNAWISTLYSPQTFASFSVSRNMNQICIYSYKTHECSNIEHWHHRGERRQYMHIRRHLKDLTKNVYHALKFPLLKYVRKQCMQ